MTTRRDFVKLTATGLLAAGGLRAVESARSDEPRFSPAGSATERGAWCALAVKLATPLLESLSRRELRKTMPVESAPAVSDRPEYTYLEGLSRLLCGLAPWLEL